MVINTTTAARVAYRVAGVARYAPTEHSHCLFMRLTAQGVACCGPTETPSGGTLCRVADVARYTPTGDGRVVF